MIVDIIGAGINLGADREGVEQGFDTLWDRLDFQKLFSRHEINNLGCIHSPSCADLGPDNSQMKHRDEIFAFNIALADRVYGSLKKGHFPLIIGGDHVLSWGSISGVSRYDNRTGCVYVDAHGDFNPAEYSPSRNVHGMHMAYLMGLTDSEYNDFYCPGIKLDKNNVFFIGTRSLDYAEKGLIVSKKLNVQYCSEIKERGIGKVADDLVAKMEASGLERFHMSFDVDCIDPKLAPGTGVPEPDGLDLDEIYYLIERLLSTGKFTSMDFVEFNPLLDIDDRTLKVCENLLSIIGRM